MRFFLSILFFFLATAIHAQCTGPEFSDRITEQERAQLQAAVDQTVFAKGIVWRASKGEKTITVIGTMHLADPRLNAVFNRVADTIAETEILLVEATAKEEALLQAEMANNPDMMFNTSGPTLPEVLPDDVWNAIVDAARARSIPPFLAAKMKPWFLGLSLSIPACAMADLMSDAPGLDQMLMDEATRVGTPQKALEPFSTLFDIMQEGSDEEQLEMLKLGLLNPDVQTEMFVSMLNSYFEEDIAEIWELSRISINYVPGLEPGQAEGLFAEAEQALLIDRNLAWIPAIENAVAGRNNITIAAGAAHLPGEFGVLKLLENRGWEIAPFD